MDETQELTVGTTMSPNGSAADLLERLHAAATARLARGEKYKISLQGITKSSDYDNLLKGWPEVEPFRKEFRTKRLAFYVGRYKVRAVRY